MNVKYLGPPVFPGVHFLGPPIPKPGHIGPIPAPRFLGPPLMGGGHITFLGPPTLTYAPWATAIRNQLRGI